MKRIIKIVNIKASFFLFMFLILAQTNLDSQKLHLKNFTKIFPHTIYINHKLFISNSKNEFIFVYDDIKIRKVDTNGTIIWDLNYDSIKPNTQFTIKTIAIKECKNSNNILITYVFYNKIDSFNSTYINDIGVMKLNGNGNILWNKTRGGDSLEYAQDIIEDENSSVYFLGTSNSNISKTKTSNSFGDYDFWIIKFDSLGNELWQKNYGGSSYEDYPYGGLIINSMNHPIFIGFSNSNNSGNKTTIPGNWIVELNENGDILKQKTIFDLGIGVFNFKKSLDKNYLISGKNFTDSFKLIKLDTNFDLIWSKNYSIYSYSSYFDFDEDIDSSIYSIRNFGTHLTNDQGFEFMKSDKFGDRIWSQEFKTTSDHSNEIILNLTKIKNKYVFILQIDSIVNEKPLNGSGIYLTYFEKPKSIIAGRVFPDFNTNCIFNKQGEYNIQNILIENKTENTYAITNDSNYSVYLFDSDTAILKIINLDSNLYVACGKDSIIVDMTEKTDTTGIDFPIRSTKTGSCINITSFNHSILRPGFWSTYQLNYQNNAFDTAYNAYIEIEIDTAKIDSILSPYSYTYIGNKLRFNLGHIRPFGYASVTYSIKLKTNVIIGSHLCQRASVFPICNLYPNQNFDSSKIEVLTRCIGNDTVELQIMNKGKNQSDWGLAKSYEDIIILRMDTFKLNSGDMIKFKYKLDTNKVFTSEIFNHNNDPVTPILIRHDDQCANKQPIILNNPVLGFNRHDEAKEYEEDCDIVRGSYDPNLKSVIPAGLFSEHYTATGSELKYRIDFQNTGTDTAFRVVLTDTLSTLLNIATFIPGASSHPYSIEFGGRAVKFIFDPIKLVDSFHNEPASHGYMTFKIKPVANLSPKTRIENKADIYFDYNSAVRTNTVFNTIFDTILIYVPKGSNSIQGNNDIVCISVFPNPTTDKFFISMNEIIPNLSIDIYDNQGKLVQSAKSKNDKLIEISTNGLSQGIYHIRCMSLDKLIVIKKIVIQ